MLQNIRGDQLYQESDPWLQMMVGAYLCKLNGHSGDYVPEYELRK